MRQGCGSDPPERQLKIAYALHGFPVLTDNYVASEIAALRAKGVEVCLFAGKKYDHLQAGPDISELVAETTFLKPYRTIPLLKACWQSILYLNLLKDIYLRIFIGGNERFFRRVKALLHCIAGIYFALLLKDRKVTHIHANHGYFASWISMIAGRILDIPFSITFHGSDLLIDRLFLDLKVKNCTFCFTVSEYNKRFLIKQLPETDPDKIIIHYLGVDVG